MNPQQVTDLLVQVGCLDSKIAQALAADASSFGTRIDILLFERKLLNRDEFYRGLSDALSIDYYDLSNFEPSPEILTFIPAKLARSYGILPVFRTASTIAVALMNPCDFQGLKSLSITLDKPLSHILADVDRIQDLIQLCYPGAGVIEKSIFPNHSSWEPQSETILGLGLYPETNNSKDQIPQNKFLVLSDEENELRSTEGGGDTPIVQFVNHILEKAVRSQASDIHLEPFETEFKIRYRVDGTLYELPSPPLHLASAMISRVKVLAKLNISERRLPQDGRMECVINGRSIDVRVSSLPTAFGESIVLRVLDQNAVTLELETLGFPNAILLQVLEMIQKPSGIFVVTGPTGSGKTTTLYSCLRKINTSHSKLLTVEDPVEYKIEGLLQVSVNENIGLSFARVLRAFLRQDPDCLMIGEIRDRETARVAIQAALTGHLVLTTLHTNDTVGAITRLENLGIEPYLLSSALEGVLAQRLIRRVCPYCRVDYQPTELQIRALDLTDEKFYCGAGCEICNNTGYLGRKGIYEFLSMNALLRELVNSSSPETIFRKKAIDLGISTLREDGLRALYTGESTIEEVLKISW